MKKRAVFFIDGFNVYHAISNPKYSIYKWLNYNKLAQCFISPQKENIQEVLYFSAYTPWDTEKQERHKTYVSALRFHGVKIILGKFKKVTRNCRATCKEVYETFEEKETDVNIAIQLVKKSFHDEYDHAYIISGDSDLVPAIELVKSIFPHKRITCIIPIGRSAEHLKQVCDFHQRIKEKHLKTNQLPDQIVIDPDKTIILYKPEKWK